MVFDKKNLHYLCLLTVFLSLSFSLIPLCILTVPILDTVCAIIRRKLKGQKIDQADKEHLHHQLLKKFSKTSLCDLYDNQIAKLRKSNEIRKQKLLEYRKISTFELPKNCVIIVTAKEINKNKISEEIYSLVAHI